MAKLDFTALGNAGGVALDEEHRKRLSEVVADYQYFRSSPLPARPVRELKAIQKHSQALAELLSEGTRHLAEPARVAVEDCFDSKGALQLAARVSPLVDALESLAGRAEKLLAAKRRAGRREDWPLRFLIAGLYGVWGSAGGRGLGCYTSEAHDDGYAGPFYRLVKKTVQQVDGSVSGPSGLGRRVIDVVKRFG